MSPGIKRNGALQYIELVCEEKGFVLSIITGRAHLKGLAFFNEQ